VFVVLMPTDCAQTHKAACTAKAVEHTVVIWRIQVNLAIFVIEISSKKWPNLPTCTFKIHEMISLLPSTGQSSMEILLAV